MIGAEVGVEVGIFVGVGVAFCFLLGLDRLDGFDPFAPLDPFGAFVGLPCRAPFLNWVSL